MRIEKNSIVNILLSFAVATSIIIFSQQGMLKRIEKFGSDCIFRLRPPIPYNPNIIIIEINDEELSKIGWWPWKRNWHSAMVTALKNLGAKYIFLDILFSEPSFEEDDDLFSLAIENAKNVYLPFAFKQYPSNTRDTIVPIEKFSSRSKGTAAINIYPDIDGVVRTIPLYFRGKEGVSYHMSLRLAMDYLGLKVKEIKPKCLILSNPAKEEIIIPLVERNKMQINWLGKWKETFSHYSFLDVLNAYQDSLEHKKPPIDINKFKNSICFVAVTATGLLDIKTSPLESEYMGVGITATALSNILDKNFVKMPPAWVNYLFVYILSLLPSLLTFNKKFFQLLLPVLFSIIIALYFLLKNGWIINVSLWLFALLISYLIITTFRYITVLIEQTRLIKLAVTDELTNLYNIRYFKLVLKNECSLSRSNNNDFCVILGDVDHFKHFNDTYGHQMGDSVLRDVAKILKAYIRPSDVVARYGGEEIIILLKGTTLKNGLMVAEKLRKNIEQHVVQDETNTCKVTISFGAAGFIPEEDTEDKIIKRADQGLYKAKELGRNRVCTIEI